MNGAGFFPVEGARLVLMDALRSRAPVLVGKAGAASEYGHAYERRILTCVMPLSLEHASRKLLELCDRMAREVGVERPGGRIVVRGPAPDGAPVGVSVTASVLGEGAGWTVRLALDLHTLTLENARAFMRLRDEDARAA